MRLLYCCPTGFFGYGVHPYLNLAGRGVVHLCGPVGAGKSSLFNSICELLFGMSPPRDGTREATETDIINAVIKRAFGVLGFEADGGSYRVVYCRNWKGTPLISGPSLQTEHGEGYGGTALYLEYWDGAAWVQRDHKSRDLRMPRMLDTWTKIQEITGIDYATFCNSAYVAQDMALQFIRGRSAEREQIITKLMQLGKYDEAEARTREEKNILSAPIAALESTISSLQRQESAIVVEDGSNLTTKIDTLKAALMSMDSQLTKLETSVHVDAVRSLGLFNQLTATKAELGVLTRQIYDKTALVERIRSGIERERQTTVVAISKLSTTSPEIEKHSAEFVHWRAIAARENQKLTSMLPGAGVCPACGSSIDDTTLNRHKDEQAQQIKKALMDQQKAEQELNDARAALQNGNARRRAEIEQERDKRIAAIEATIVQKMADILTDEARKDQSERGIKALEQEYQTLDTTIGQATIRELSRQRISTAEELAKSESALTILDQRRSDKNRINAERADLEHRLAVQTQESQEWNWLAKQFPRVKQLKFASGSEYLNDRIAHYLDVLTDGATHVCITPFRVKKDSQRKPVEQRTVDDYIFEFGVSVEEGHKQGVPVQLYSGGEREKITLALVAAFHDLTTSRGAACNVLMLDEVITFLDEDSIGRVVSLVDDLRLRMESMFIIGHDATLGNLLRADETWHAEKSAGITTIRVES